MEVRKTKLAKKILNNPKAAEELRKMMIQKKETARVEVDGVIYLVRSEDR
jgi:hypothetical protein